MAYCLQSIDKEVFEKAVRCARLTEPRSRSLFNSLWQYLCLAPTGHGKSLIYQICPAVARELASTEKKFPSEPMLIVISPLISLIADQISSSVKWGWQAYMTPRVHGICTFANYFSVSLPFFCRLTLVYEGHFILCYKEKLEPVEHAMVNFKRSYTECKYGGPLRRRPGRATWKRG